MTTLGTYDAKYLTAYSGKTGIQTMTTDGKNFFVNGKPVSEEFIVHRITDKYQGRYTAELTAAGERLRAYYEAAE